MLRSGLSGSYSTVTAWPVETLLNCLAVTSILASRIAGPSAVSIEYSKTSRYVVPFPRNCRFMVIVPWLGVPFRARCLRARARLIRSAATSTDTPIKTSVMHDEDHTFTGVLIAGSSIDALWLGQNDRARTRIGAPSFVSL